MAVWVTRAGRHGGQEPFALENKVVVAGWDKISDLSAINNRAELLQSLQKAYASEAENTLKNWETQLWAFGHRITKGDIVILPRKRTSTVAFGKVAGSYRFAAGADENCKHQIPVEWINVDLPRQAIDGDLRFSIGGAMTVFQVKRNEAEIRIRALLEGRSSIPTTDQFIDDDSESEFDPEEIAFNKIADHISRKFRGHDLERLVNAVLVAQGFVTQATDIGPDGGVDILAAKGALGSEQPKICVQVKSQEKPVDVKVVRELQGVINNFGADLGLLVSWGGFNSKADEEARRNFFRIRLWGPETLVAQIQAIYEKLDEDIQKDLPLKRIWTLVEDKIS